MHFDMVNTKRIIMNATENGRFFAAIVSNSFFGGVHHSFSFFLPTFRESVRTIFGTTYAYDSI